MPWARDNLTTLIEKTLADIAARMRGVNPFLRRSFANVIGRVVAAQHNDQLGYLDWQARMAVPVTAEGEYLYAWGALKGIYPKAPSAAVGTATIANGVPNSPVEIGAQLIRSDGVLYEETDGLTLDIDGNGILHLEALEDGEAGNSEPGTPLRFVEPVNGVPETATVVTMTGGAAVENAEAFRTRMLKIYAAPPQGGDLRDYEEWALEVPGVTRAWVSGPKLNGPGSVSVYFMMDDEDHPNGVPIGTDGASQYEDRIGGLIPQATGDQLAVADHIFPLRPVTALVYGVSPTDVPFDLTLAEVPVDDEIRDGIAAAIEGLLLREASPGGTTLTDLSTGGTLSWSHINDAISAVPGLDNFVLIDPTADVTVGAGEILVPGTITYI